MHVLSIHPVVYEELESARRWYAEKSPALGDEFLDEIDFAFNAIQATPEIWPPFDRFGGIRHFIVHRFPFGVFYRFSTDTIQILAVGHLHRRPGYWKTRIRQSKTTGKGQSKCLIFTKKHQQ